MKWFNWILTALAVAVLMVTLSIAWWLRGQLIGELERDVRNVQVSYDPYKIFHGPEGTTLARFEAVEELAARAKESPYIRDIVVTKLAENNVEIPIVPFTMRAEKGRDWAARLKDWKVDPIGPATQPLGFIYLDLDRRIIASLNWTIAALGVAITLMLATLLARVWLQATSLQRTVIELNERRRELIRLERLALAGQLSAGLLHDLRKPVLNIQHSLDDIADALGDFAPAATALQELRRYTQLFFQMLTESQIERFVKSDRVAEEYVDIVPMLDFALNLVRYERRGVNVERKAAGDLPPILAQPFRLIQLFSNLILNAFQALGGRGNLTIATRKAGDFVEVSFTDDGPGIPPETLERIFDPFFTTKPEGEGTGLGLSICRMIVEDLGGEIRAESRTGGPTNLRVILPVTRD